MEAFVWLAIAVRFVAGITVKASSRTVGTIFAFVWVAVLTAVSGFLISQDTVMTTFEVFAAAFAGSLAAFFAGFALLGLIRDWRSRKARTA